MPVSLSQSVWSEDKGLRSGWGQLLGNPADPRTETKQMDGAARAGFDRSAPRGSRGPERAVTATLARSGPFSCLLGVRPRTRWPGPRKPGLRRAAGTLLNYENVRHGRVMWRGPYERLASLPAGSHRRVAPCAPSLLPPLKGPDTSVCAGDTRRFILNAQPTCCKRWLWCSSPPGPGGLLLTPVLPEARQLGQASHPGGWDPNPRTVSPPKPLPPSVPGAGLRQASLCPALHAPYAVQLPRPPRL